MVSAGLEDDFESGVIDPLKWCSVDDAAIGTGCGAFAGTGALHFDGPNADRFLETCDINAAPCTTIDFCLFLGNNASGGAPCENVDAGDDIYPDYSINGGASWITIQMFPHSDWDTGGPYANAWACFSIPIPAGALTGTTRFRWFQTPSACTGCDNWSLDNINITCAFNSTFDFAWTGQAIGNPTDQDPIVTPTMSGSYSILVTDSATGCTYEDTISITVTCPPCSPPIPTLTHITCAGACDGSMIANAIGPDGPPWTFTWTDMATSTVIGTLTTMGSVDSIQNLCAGIYKISITDTTGCTRDSIVTLLEPVAMTLATSSDTTICIGGTATILANAAGGNGAPYTYTWVGIPGNGPHPVNPLVNTTYVVTSSDGLGCTSPADSVLVNISPPLSVVTSPNDTVCYGDDAILSA
ncbi:MAG: hypothetical protein JKY54_10990, partial [Flavobacteriales bacterium]|nr:hypothetical protein [Flavobacteriales bacterium]